MVNWAQACATQLNRPLMQMQQANRGGNLFAVSILLCYAVAKCGGAPARTSAPRNCTVYGRSLPLTRDAGCFVRAGSCVQCYVVFALGD